jgi:hypothetical protein
MLNINDWLQISAGPRFKTELKRSCSRLEPTEAGTLCNSNNARSPSPVEKWNSVSKVGSVRRTAHASRRQPKPWFSFYRGWSRNINRVERGRAGASKLAGLLQEHKHTCRLHRVENSFLSEYYLSEVLSRYPLRLFPITLRYITTMARHILYKSVHCFLL